MILYDLLNLIHDDCFPLVADEYGIDSRPNSVFTITLCFMSEEETWETVNIQSAILIPWYLCEVSSINGSDKENDICVWLKDTEYVKKYFSQYIKWVTKIGIQNYDG